MSLAIFLAAAISLPSLAAEPPEGEWISLFDGKTLDNWKPNENPSSWKVEDGVIVADGDRSHLFYEGPVNDAKFKNFELEADVYVHKKGSSAIYFHAANMEPGWGVKGLPVKITNTRVAATATGGIYYIPETYRKQSPVPDEKWFHIRVVVQGKNAKVFIDGEKITDYNENLDNMKPFQKKNLAISDGTFALQCHGKNQRVDYKNIKVKILPD